MGGRKNPPAYISRSNPRSWHMDPRSPSGLTGLQTTASGASQGTDSSVSEKQATIATALTRVAILAMLVGLQAEKKVDRHRMDAVLAQ